jgi:phosphoglycerate dehydrogenase-like enzyme
MNAAPRVAVVPAPDESLMRAVTDGGGHLVQPEEAEAMVWTDPHDPYGLAKALSVSPARWVQLPLAGIEAFVVAGVLDTDRTWTSAKGIYGRACAEHALALMLAGARHIHAHLLSRRWDIGKFTVPHRQLDGSTVLVIGTGGIGRALASMLSPFDVEILAVNRTGSPLAGASRTVTSGALKQVVGEADFVVLAAALTGATFRLVDGEMLSSMRRTAWVINVARGGLIDTDALVDALDRGVIAGAGLDVTDPEPLPPSHALWRCQNAIITPHVANTLDMSLPRLRERVRRNVERFAQGRPLEGILDPVAGY